jgi:phenylalanyl-tRNA synthetase beta chain
MPTINLNLKETEKLIGQKLPRKAEELDTSFECVKAEVEEIKGNDLKLEIKGNDRPDIWNEEGIARQMRGQLGLETGLKKYSVHKSDYVVKVSGVKQRPFIACAVVKGVKLTQYILEQLIQQQEKIHGTYGRNRKKASIGLYNADMVTFPLRYEETFPDKNAFVPLGWEKKATPQEILDKHDKGKEFANILSGQKKYPIFLDSEKKVLSLPPIINSNDLGNISEKTENILVEVTGTDWKTVKIVLNIMALSLADRGGKIYSVKIQSPHACVTPDLSTEKIEVKLNDINSLIGMNFTLEVAGRLLRKGRYGVEFGKKSLRVEIPCYRTDIMHPVDIIEDVAIAYGFNKFVPDPLEIYTVGSLSKKEVFSNKVRELMVGFGLQEIMTFTLVSEETLSKKVNLTPKLTQIENPMNKNYTSLRNALIPTMLEFLSKNTHNKFPQRIFEVGNCIVDKKDQLKLAVLVTHDQANYTEAKSMLESVAKNLKVDFSLKPIVHPTFIEGRSAEVLLGGKHLGVIGEVSPQVLENWGLEKPVICFEINIDRLVF